MKVMSVAGATACLLATSASAEVANIAEYDGGITVADDVDPFTEEHVNSVLICGTPAAGVAIYCEAGGGRTVMLHAGGNVPEGAEVRLRVGTGDVDQPDGLPGTDS